VKNSYLSTRKLSTGVKNSSLRELDDLEQGEEESSSKLRDSLIYEIRVL
jgi:hypothetical protein